jgi:hypothetical protein
MRALASPPAPLVLQAAIPRRREAAALALSLVAALLGVAALLPVDVVHIGRGSP